MEIRMQITKALCRLAFVGQINPCSSVFQSKQVGTLKTPPSSVIEKKQTSEPENPMVLNLAS